MIVYGEATHTIRARTHARAFARVRAFLERCTDAREARFGIGVYEIVTLDRIAAEMEGLDDSDPMAGLNGLVWSFDCVLRDPRTGEPLVCEERSCVGLFAYAGSVSVRLRLVFPYDEHGGEMAHFARATAETMGVKLSAKKFRRAAVAGRVRGRALR
jgi:hypothetical protein